MALFITFEGGEGAGKTTQIKRLANHLAAQGHDVLLTREPGGTIEAETVRDLLVNGEPGKWSSTAEALLNYAARDSHLQRVIRPSLTQGKTVVCDRFMDSTRAYQAYGGDCPMPLIDALEQSVVGLTRPQFTVIFDLAPELGLERARMRGEGIEDRYERKGPAFHASLRRGFLEIARHEPKRCMLLDASQSIEKVWQLLLSGLKERGLG